LDSVSQLLGIFIRLAGDKQALAQLRRMREEIGRVGKESEKTTEKAKTAAQRQAEIRKEIRQTHKTVLDTGKEWNAGLDRVRQRYDRIALALAAVGAGLVMIGRKAAYAYGEMELSQLTMQSFVGDAERAKDVYEDLLQFAATTPVQIEEIMRGTTNMLAFNMATLESAAAVDDLKDKLLLFGLAAKVSRLPMGMEQVVRALNDLRRGVIEIRQLAAIGLSREALSKEGVAFGKGGELVSGHEEAFEAAIRILRKRFGLLTEEVDKALATWISNIADKVAIMWMRIGEALETPIRDVIKALVDYITRLGDAILENKDDWQALAKIIAAGFLPIVGPVLAFLKGFLYLAENSPGTLKLVATAISGVTAALLGMWVLQKITVLVMALKNVWLGLNVAFGATKILLAGGPGLNVALANLATVGVNPVVMALGLLAAVIGTVIYLVGVFRKETKSLAEQLHETAEAHRKTAQALEQQRVKQETTAEGARTLTDRITELLKQQQLTRSETDELEKSYGELHKLLPHIPPTLDKLADAFENAGDMAKYLGEQSKQALKSMVMMAVKERFELTRELLTKREELAKRMAELPEIVHAPEGPWRPGMTGYYEGLFFRPLWGEPKGKPGEPGYTGELELTKWGEDYYAELGKMRELRAEVGIAAGEFGKAGRTLGTLEVQLKSLGEIIEMGGGIILKQPEAFEDVNTRLLIFARRAVEAGEDISRTVMEAGEPVEKFNKVCARFISGLLVTADLLEEVEDWVPTLAEKVKKAGGVRIEPQSGMPGDLVFWREARGLVHVGVISDVKKGQIRYIHEPGMGGPPTEAEWTPISPKMEMYALPESIYPLSEFYDEAVDTAEEIVSKVDDWLKVLNEEYQAELRRLEVTSKLLQTGLDERQKAEEKAVLAANILALTRDYVERGLLDKYDLMKAEIALLEAQGDVQEKILDERKEMLDKILDTTRIDEEIERALEQAKARPILEQLADAYFGEDARRAGGYPTGEETEEGEEDVEEGFTALEEALAAGIEGVVRSITSGRIHNLAQTVANSLIRIVSRIFEKMMEAGKFGEGLGGLIKGNIVMGLVAGGIEAIAGLFGGGKSEPVHTIVDNWRDFLRKDYETEFAIPGHIGLAGLANTYVDMAGITVNVQQGDADEIARQVGRVTEETVRRGLAPS